LEVIVRDRDEAQKLIGWLYNEHSKVDKIQMGCELKSIGFGHAHEKQIRLVDTLKRLINFAEVDDWIDETNKNLDDVQTNP
jgi:hypothetical protein